MFSSKVPKSYSTLVCKTEDPEAHKCNGYLKLSKVKDSEMVHSLTRKKKSYLLSALTLVRRRENSQVQGMKHV